MKLAELKHQVRLNLDRLGGLTHSEPIHVAVANRLKHVVRGAVISKAVLPVIYAPRLKKYSAQPGPADKFKFLVLRYRYADFADEQSGPGAEEHVVSAPLRAANIGEVAEYYYDIDHSQGVFGDRTLVDMVMQTRPDVIILSSYNHQRNINPNFEVIKSIRAYCQIPVVVIWHDTLAVDPLNYFAYLSSGTDLNIIMDSDFLADQSTVGADFIRMAPTLDDNLFRVGDVAPDIPVSFVGSTSGYRSVRKEYLTYLYQQGVEVLLAGGMENRISIEEYADVIRRSKISLNFSFSIPGTHQIKARVLEATMSNSLLLESKNSETSRFFTPMADYVEFESKEDLVDKVRYYLEHEDERREIALNGHRKALKEYNHHVYWGRMVAKLKELNLLVDSQQPMAAKAKASHS
jgi:hypothetical protein